MQGDASMRARLCAHVSSSTVPGFSGFGGRISQPEPSETGAGTPGRQISTKFPQNPPSGHRVLRYNLMIQLKRQGKENKT